LIIAAVTRPMRHHNSLAARRAWPDHRRLTVHPKWI
jgi:hypothetical protein